MNPMTDKSKLRSFTNCTIVFTSCPGPPIDVGRKPRIVGNKNDRHGNVEESRHHGQERACQEIGFAAPVRMWGEKRVFAVSG